MNKNKFVLESKADASVSRSGSSFLDTTYEWARRLCLWVVFFVPFFSWYVKNGGSDQFKIGGVFHAECYDQDGKLKWSDVAYNAVSNLALNDVLDVYLGAASQTSVWYLGLVDNTGFSAYAAADTMSSHAGWTESVAYSNTNRVTWTPGSASSQSVSNGTTSDFTINASATIKGVFLTSNNTKSGTTGKLFATASFSGGNQTVNSGDTLKVTYTCSATTS